LKDELVELVSEQNARSLLQKIQESAVEFNILQNNALEGKMDLPKVWKLYYYLRNVKDADLREKIEKNIISKYEKSLLAAFTDKIATNPVVFPLAARWAELITRK
jgi:CRISPR-associated protein Csm1